MSPHSAVCTTALGTLVPAPSPADSGFTLQPVEAEVAVQLSAVLCRPRETMRWAQADAVHAGAASLNPVSGHKGDSGERAISVAGPSAASNTLTIHGLLLTAALTAGTVRDIDPAAEAQLAADAEHPHMQPLSCQLQGLAQLPRDRRLHLIQRQVSASATGTIN